MIYTLADLTDEERAWLLDPGTTYEVFHARVGRGMARGLEAGLAACLKTNVAGVYGLSMGRLLAVREGMGDKGNGGWLERWACRAIVEVLR